MTVLAYVRVSTVHQNEAGQRAEIERWVRGHAREELVEWYVDRASGDSLERPELDRLQGEVMPGDVVVVWKLDRLSRSMRDGVNTLADWCDRGIRVVSVTQQLDFAGATGRMLAAVLLAVGEMEQEARRERIRAGVEAAKAAGKYVGRKYGTTKKRPRRALELRERGLSWSEVGQALGVSSRTAQRYVKRAALKELERETSEKSVT